MKHFIIFSLLICITLPSCSQSKKTQVSSNESSSSEVTTTYYLIRHAEKVLKNKNDPNPSLTKEGKLRSKRWANEILDDVKFDAVYSTDYKRTRNTAKPTAKKNGHDLKLYDPTSMDINSFKNDTEGKTVLVVGHSNTTPMLVNKLIEEQKYQDIDDSEYGTLFIVTIKDGIASSILKVFN